MGKKLSIKEARELVFRQQRKMEERRVHASDLVDWAQKEFVDTINRHQREYLKILKRLEKDRQDGRYIIGKLNALDRLKKEVTNE